MRRLIVLGLVVLALAAPALAAPAAAAPPAQGGTTHVVQLGETLYSIAMRYGVDAGAIARANGIANPNYIFAGQRLTIPGSYVPAPPPAPGACRHVVKLGENLTSIAWQNGTSVSALMAANGITNPNYIFAGQSLVIPGCAGPGPGPAPEPPSCGYRYAVRPGDTLSGIAARHGMGWLTVARANGIGYPYYVYAGQQLFIPCGGTPPHHPDGHKPHPATPTKTPPLRPAACPREIQIVAPREGETIRGVVQIVGTASIADFQFYKLEYAMGHNPLENAFASINNVYRTPVWDSVLGTWYAGNMPDGAYTLRLTAVDVRGQFPRPCNVHIHIDN